MVTIADRLAATAGKPTGFDYMRLTLSLLVICWHSVVTSYGDVWERQLGHGPLRVYVGLLMPMFFALSGFLVASSLERTKSILTFLGLRGLRIVPALAVDTLFSALILGVIFTNLPLQAYFAHPDLHRYFLNIIGYIHFTLPGVFESNPSGKVNGQLWTIPFELECYLALTALALVGLYRRRAMFLAAVLAAHGVVLVIAYLDGDFGRTHGRVLVLCFLLGVTVYAYRDRLPWNGGCFAMAAILSLSLLSVPSGAYWAPFPIVYGTVYLGLLNPRKIFIIGGGDYSYGLFLYGYPLQQAISATFPDLRIWYANILMAIPLTFMFAAMSWHLFEKPALAQKHRLFAFEQWWLGRRSELFERAKALTARRDRVIGKASGDEAKHRLVDGIILSPGAPEK